MIQQDSVWTRIGSWVKTLQRDENQPLLAGTDEDLSVPADKKDDAVELPAAKKEEALGAESGAQWTFPVPWRKGTGGAQHPSPHQTKVLDLMQSIHDHMQSQNQRSERLVNTLTELAPGLQTLPESARSQGDNLARLASELRASNQHLSGIGGLMKEWSKNAQAQKSALESIVTQLESSARGTNGVAHRLESLGEAVKILGDTSAQQLERIEGVHEAAQDQGSRLVELMDRQSQRFTLTLLVTFVLAIIAAVSMSITIIS